MHVDAPSKYRPHSPITITNRRWPDAAITRPPLWCSVDLRDGNQALIDPMDTPRKMRLWNALLAMGFKDIEIGFPAASQTDFDFIRTLVDGNHIPDDVTVQVLTQSREDLITRTFEAIAGIKKVVVHLYNSTSEAQRRIVFGFDQDKCIELARYGTRIVKALSAKRPEGEVIFEYTPESFTGTEPDFAVRVVEAVAEIWGIAPDRKMIVNLPATVEMYTPNVYADVIEWFGNTVKGRENMIISVHPHNDRGTAVAAAELAIMAGADRVEGTLFGNGERTGNVDLCTLALNMFTQGINPGLNISDIDSIRQTAEDCTGIAVHPRHPYAGELVYTAFSGSHQDAIRKGFTARKQSNSDVWEVPYLPIDPADVGRTYEAVIRINSQSGKGGVAYILEQDYGLELPKAMQADFAREIQKISDKVGRELSSAEIKQAFDDAYIAPGALSVVDYTTVPAATAGRRALTATIRWQGKDQGVQGEGTGPIDGFVHAVNQALGRTFTVANYHEHAIGEGTDAQAACYIALADGSGKPVAFGAATDANVTFAALKAVCSAINRTI